MHAEGGGAASTAGIQAQLDSLRAGQAELKIGQAQLQAGQVELKAGQAGLQAGQAQLQAGLRNLAARAANSVPRPADYPLQPLRAEAGPHRGCLPAEAGGSVFPATRMELAVLTEERLAKLESFYAQSFGRDSESLERRVVEFQWFIGMP